VATAACDKYSYIRIKYNINPQVIIDGAALKNLWINFRSGKERGPNVIT
jgi:hypothetical protein